MMPRTCTMFLAALAAAACGEDAPMPVAPEISASPAHLGGSGEPATYEVSITNLTSHQPMTPPLAITHRPAVKLFDPGHPASAELQQIAENGNLGPMLDLLDASSHVHDVVVSSGDPGPLFPGEERSVEIEATRDTRWLSVAAMLICTNDGFTGLAYSGGAGTGMSNPASAEGGAVHHRHGITGGADPLVNVHDWDDPVARIEITRVS